MSPQESEARSDDAVLTPATPGAETLGSPDTQPEESESSKLSDDEVLAPATPAAEAFGIAEDEQGSGS